MAPMIIAGFVMVLAMLMTLARMDILKFLGYATVVDVLFTSLMFELFSGTFSGIIAGAFSGIFMTIALYIMRGVIGCKKLRIRRNGYGIPRVTWVFYGPEHFRGKWSKAS